MRYGLMSNHRMSWSKVGERVLMPNQQEYANRYLYSAIDPIDGDNFHIIGWNDVNTKYTELFLCALKEHYPNHHLIIIWDNAPFHKPKTLHKVPHTTIIPLPSYSPELNPVERFFGEIRKVTANKIYQSGIDTQEQEIANELVYFMQNKNKVTQLCGYEWIYNQWNQIISVAR